MKRAQHGTTAVSCWHGMVVIGVNAVHVYVTNSRIWHKALSWHQMCQPCDKADGQTFRICNVVEWGELQRGHYCNYRDLGWVHRLLAFTALQPKWVLISMMVLCNAVLVLLWNSYLVRITTKASALHTSEFPSYIVWKIFDYTFVVYMLCVYMFRIYIMFTCTVISTLNMYRMVQLLCIMLLYLATQKLWSICLRTQQFKLMLKTAWVTNSCLFVLINTAYYCYFVGDIKGTAPPINRVI